jgi:hypothetical protein
MPVNPIGSLNVLVLGFALTLVIILSSVSFAWTSETHDWFATHALTAMNLSPERCGFNFTAYYSTYPDKVLHDNVNHIYYNTDIPCGNGTERVSKYYYCPTKNETDAMDKAYKYLMLANKSSTYCSALANITIATHYFSDSFSPPHNVQGLPDKCHSYFEATVNKNMIENEKQCLVRWCDLIFACSSFPLEVDRFDRLAIGYMPTEFQWTSVPSEEPNFIGSFWFWVLIIIVLLAIIGYHVIAEGLWVGKI